MARLLRYLGTWSLSQLLIVSVLWVAVVVLAALQTPPVRYLFAVLEMAKFMGPVNVDMPVYALRAVVIATPIVALVPPVVVFGFWRRARRAGVAVRAA